MDEIRKEAMCANPVETATPVRDFLKPDYENSLEAKLEENCNVIIVMELTSSSILYNQKRGLKGIGEENDCK